MKTLIKIVAYALFTAVFLWALHIGQMNLARFVYIEAYKACQQNRQKTGAILPQGATKGFSLAKQAHTDNQ